MPPVTTAKGFSTGWNPGEVGWGPYVNEDFRRVDAQIVDHWAQERNSSLGLVYGFTGGLAISGGVLTRVAAGTVTLTALTTNYVERTPAGVVSANTSGWTAGRIPMAKIVTNASGISSIEDWRSISLLGYNADFDGRNATWSGTVTTGGKTTSGSFELTPGVAGPAVSATTAGLTNNAVADQLALYAKGGMSLFINGTQCFALTNAGHFVAGIDNAFDIGASGANRPRDVFISGVYRGNQSLLTASANSPLDLASVTNTSSGGSSGAFFLATADTIQGHFGAGKNSNGVLAGSRTSHPLFLVINNSAVWQVTTSGHLFAFADNSVDIGASGANRPRNLYVAAAGVFGTTLAVGTTLTVGTTLVVTGATTLAALAATSGAFSAGIDVSAGTSKAARATATWNGATSQSLAGANTFEVSITGNTTLTLTSPTTGVWYTFLITQDATGGRTITWPGTFRWPSATAPTLSGANKRDTISAYWNGTDYTAFVGGLNA